MADLLGDTTAPARNFPPEPEVGGFDNNAVSHRANPLLVESYSIAARDLATRTVNERLETLAPCSSAETAAGCGTRFITEFGKRAFRRPLDAAETDSFTRLFDRAEASMGYEKAIGLVLEAMLQSPQFLYRVEAPLLEDEKDTVVPLGPYEMASRLSYFLWGSLPDDDLFDAADSGELASLEQIENQVRRMLDSPKAAKRVTEFHRKWLGLGRFETVSRQGAPEGANQAWETSLLSFIDETFWSPGGTVADLFTSSTVYVDASLAPLYGATVADADGFVAIDLGEERSGLLTQPGLMAMLAHPDQSSPIQRGVFLRERILCDPVPAPPPSVNNNPPDPDPNLTTRERFAVHTEDPGCASCHSLIDPVGFGFEAFDHLGRFRTEENDQPIDTSGEVIAAPNPALDGPFVGAAELSSRLAESDVVAECLTRHWYRFAMGRLETESDECNVTTVTSAVAASGGDLREVLVSIALSDSFRFRRAHREK